MLCSILGVLKYIQSLSKQRIGYHRTIQQHAKCDDNTFHTIERCRKQNHFLHSFEIILFPRCALYA